jgi:hypothetical protein
MLLHGNRRINPDNSLLQIVFAGLYFVYLEIMLPLFGIKGFRIEYNRCSNRNNSWYLFRIPFCGNSRYAIKKIHW